MREIGRAFAAGSVDIATALVALRVNVLRSVLTALGVMIGVLAVTLAVAIGEGAKVSVQQAIYTMGSNMAMVFPQPESRGGRRSLERGRLTGADGEAVEHQVPGVTAIAPQLRNTTQLIVDGRHVSTSTIGATPGYAEVSNINVNDGRFLKDADVAAAARVIVLGPTVATSLFGEADPIGRAIRVNRVPFTVIGVMEAKGSSFGRDNDDVAVVPITTARQRFGTSSPGPDDVAALFVGFDEETDLEDAKRRIIEVLRQRNHVQAEALNPFTITTTQEFAEQTKAITMIFQAVLVAIASVSLLVGGVGIMNIMLISVTERTREIGLRMALGARRRDIRNQFLTESAVLCLLGGAIGLVVALVLANLFERLAGFPAPIGAGAAAATLMFSAGLGLMFGSYPAIRASRLSPIDALRSE